MGFTRSRTSGKESTPVHPHARGVYVFRLFRHQCISGPSPRTWGLLHAGEGHQGIRPVHPHARGVYGLYKLNSLFNYGPSPRTWGLLRQSAGVPAVLRSIPTHVGFTMFALEMVVLPAGPSPRTWGLRHCRHISVVLVRSIPTHVGFTQDGRAVAASVAVHPHARGVYITLNGAVGNYTGPSPRTWGLRICILPTPRWFRSIPTHVGFTTKKRGQNGMHSVHPHARGVYPQKMCPP